MGLRRRWIVVGRAIDAGTVRALIERYRGLADRGAHRVVIDAVGPSGCDRAGLLGRHELLQGWPRPEVRGGRLSQFFAGLHTTPTAELPEATARIRALRGTHPGQRPARARRAC